MAATHSGYYSNGRVFGALLVPEVSGCVIFHGKLCYSVITTECKKTYAVDLYELEGIPIFAGGGSLSKRLHESYNG